MKLFISKQAGWHRGLAAAWTRLLAFFLIPAGYIVAFMLVHPFKLPLLRRPLHLLHEDVSFCSVWNNTRLRGWWLPAAGKRAVILAHGYRGHRNNKNFMQVAEVLQQHGYNVLLFDFRGCCQSGGFRTTAGMLEQYDLAGAIEFVRQQKQMEHIAIAGWSMGAAAAILAARLTPVQALICDSPYADLDAYLQQQLSVWTRLPRLFTPYIIQALQHVTGQSVARCSPVQTIRALAHTPVCFIHCQRDPIIPYNHTLQLHEACPGAKKLWITDGAHHIESHIQQPQLYCQTVLAFLRTHMPKY